MQAVKAYFDGSSFVPITPIKAKRNQAAIITILEETLPVPDSKTFEQFFGALSDDCYDEITQALKDTERVDVDEW